MYRIQKSAREKETQLRCPVCSMLTRCSADDKQSAFGITYHSEPGQLTECDQCMTMLEYGGRIGALTLRPASASRVLSFNKLSEEDHWNPSVQELVEYARKYRQMPGRNCRLRIYHGS